MQAFWHTKGGREEIWEGNVLLTEKNNPEWLNERVLLAEEMLLGDIIWGEWKNVSRERIIIYLRKND